MAYEKISNRSVKISFCQKCDKNYQPKSELTVHFEIAYTPQIAIDVIKSV